MLLAAFWSRFGQLAALVGPDGIVPAERTLASLWETHGWLAIWYAPSVFWCGTSVFALELAAAMGLIAGAALLLNLAPRLAAGTAWVLLLSIAALEPPPTVNFFNWPPDRLLLECTFLAVFVAPRGWRPGVQHATAPPTWARWLLYFVAFRLMFGSGFGKLYCGQEVWSNLSAIQVDFVTRPSPTALAHYLHHWPLWVHQALAGFTLAVQVGLGPLYFVPGNPRRLAAVSGIALMTGILLTGNYRILNLLTIGLMVSMLDDGFWRGIARRLGFGERAAPDPKPPLERRWVRLSLAPVGLALFLLAGHRFWRETLQLPAQPALLAAEKAVAPLRLVHAYGLFGRVLTERQVLIVEGSQDGETWAAYGLPSNPDRLDRRPPFFAPYHYFFDFRLWIGGPGECKDQQEFFGGLARALLHGSEPVLALFTTRPFDGAPKFVRLQRYRYWFSEPEQRARGIWWQREGPEPWCPPVTLDGDDVVLVGD